MRESLLQLGFTKNESIIYETLCKYKELSGNELSKKAGIDRSVTYNLLSNLSEKGAVRSVIKTNKRLFSISEPENLLREIKLKENIAKDVIKEVKKIQQQDEYKNSVEIYEGVAASRKFYSLIAAQEKEIMRTFGGDGSMLKRIGIYLEQYKKSVKNKQVTIKLLAGQKYQNLKMFKNVPSAEYIQTKSKCHSASCSVLGEYVIFHQYMDNPQIIMIHNPLISEMMRDIFDTTWKLYPKNKHK